MDKTITIDQLDAENLANISTITTRVKKNKELIVAERSPHTIRKGLIRVKGDLVDLPLTQTIYVVDKNSEEFTDEKQAILTVREKLEQLEKYEYFGFKMTVPG